MQPAEYARNQRAAMEAGDFDAAALWAADNDDPGGMHDSHDATGGYCDYAGGHDGYDDWPGGPENDGTCGNDATNRTNEMPGFSAGADGGGKNPKLGMLSPLVQNLAPVVPRGGAKVRTAIHVAFNTPVPAASTCICQARPCLGTCKQQQHSCWAAIIMADA